MGWATSGWSRKNDTVSYVAYEQKGDPDPGGHGSIRLMNDAPENHG